MPQLHVYVAAEVARVVRERAPAKGRTVSGYRAERVVREVAADWPQGDFDQVVLVTHNTRELGRAAGLRLEDGEA